MPNDVLGRIWNLADRDQRGHLGLTEFIIAMHLLASYKNGSMRALPQILPAGLYEAASRRGPPRQVSASRPTSDGAPASGIPRQLTGAGFQGQTSPSSIGFQGQGPSSRSQTLPFQQVTPTGDQWAVSPQDKAQFDSIFATVDTQNRGYITGEQAVGFFSNSRLPEDALAQIWDLADINSEGQLTRDEFAVAMYLIRQQRSKREGRDVLPQSLPPNLIPPSMRRQPIAPQQPTAPTFDNAANITAPKSASEDLFGLDAFSSPAPATAAPLQAKTTGDSSYGATPPRTQASPAPQPSQIQQQPSHFKPFIPSSSFGQTMMTPQSSGTPSAASPSTQNRALPQQKQVSAMDDLLGDNDPEVSKRLTNETSELANLSNQVSTLGGQMQEVKVKRGSTEQNLSQARSQKRDFEGRLGQLRSAYEQEVREVQALEERLRASRNDATKLQQEMAMIQGTHQDLQNQHRQIVEAFNTDQNDNVNLKERIRQTNAEIAELKPQVERMRSDARQQKGLVAINRKQLATNEQELEKIKAELTEAAREHEEAKRELEQSQRDLEAASKAITEARSPPVASKAITEASSHATAVAGSQAVVASPAASNASMNPFYQRPSNPTGTERGITSPFTPQNISSPNHNAFDNFFGGPALGSSANAVGPPPTTSFSNDGTSAPREVLQQQIPSQASSEGPGIPTPAGSPPPSTFDDLPPTASEPPPPPQSRQITSSFLPMRPNMVHAGSDTSSTRAMAPASQMGDRPEVESSTERQLSTSETQIPASPKQRFADMAAKAPQAETQQFTPPSAEQTSSASNKGVSHQEAAVPDEFESSGMPSSKLDVPGAFPGDEITPEPSFYQSTPYSSKLDPRVDSIPRSQAATSAPDVPPIRNDDPFGMPGNSSNSPATANDDFDSAFSGFGGGKERERPNGAISEAPKAHGEFPPIRELVAADESDSDEDHGFDDDFTRHSANRTTESGPNRALQDPATANEGQLAPVRPPFDTMNSNTSLLPTPGAQMSPPSYDQTVKSPSQGPGQRKESNQFPAEYSGLLPSRDNPTSPITSPLQSTTTLPSNIGSAAGIDRGINFFGGDSPEHAAGHAIPGSAFTQDHSPMLPGASTTAPYAYTQNPAPAQQSQPFGPAVPAKAPVHDDFDDEFADLENAKEESEHGDDFTPTHRNDFEEFNPTFDSPSASRHTAQSSSTFPSSEPFADFESSLSGPGSTSRQLGVPPSTTTTTAEPPSHDWDAIFAGLDTSANNGIQPGPLPKDFPKSIAQGPVQAQPRISHDKNLVNAGESSRSVAKPALNRSVTEDVEQDDPILKRLTGMGYPREESLQALEKFDYNLDKVS